MSAAPPVAPRSKDAGSAARPGAGPRLPPRPLVTFRAVLGTSNVESTSRPPPPPRDALSCGHEERTRRHPQAGGGDRRERGHESDARDDDADALDPLRRALAQPAPIGLTTAATGAPGVAPGPGPVTMPPLETIVERYVRRFALSGDRRRGAARIEIGEGELAGSAVTISAEGGEVALVIEAPPYVDARPYRDRLASRLRARGLRVEIALR